MKEFIRLNPIDNVAVALHDLQQGQRVTLSDDCEVMLREDINFGHKVALQPIARGQQVLKYGLPIGSATRDIQAGEHVHEHNLKSDYVWREDR
jgi:altronate hydrolase